MRANFSARSSQTVSSVTGTAPGRTRPLRRGRGSDSGSDDVPRAYVASPAASCLDVTWLIQHRGLAEELEPIPGERYHRHVANFESSPIENDHASQPNGPVCRRSSVSATSRATAAQRHHASPRKEPEEIAGAVCLPVNEVRDRLRGLSASSSVDSAPDGRMPGRSRQCRSTGSQATVRPSGADRSALHERDTTATRAAPGSGRVCCRSPSHSPPGRSATAQRCCRTGCVHTRSSSRR